MTDLRTRIASRIIGELLGQAEQRGDYGSFDDNGDGKALVHLDTSIDPDKLADEVIRELESTHVLVERWQGN